MIRFFRLVKFALPEIILFLVILWACSSLFTQGYFTNHDGNFHIARSFHLTQELKNGQFPVRISTQAAHGYGYPIFMVFYPLPYYLTAVVNLFGLPITESWKFTNIFFTIFSVFTFYYWSKSHFSRLAALTGSVIFALAPFRILSLFVTGQIGVTASLAFIPLLFLGIDQVINKSRFGQVLIAVSLFGLLTSHLITLVVFVPLIIWYLGYKLIADNKPINAKTLLPSFVLGIGLSASFIMPLLFQINWLRMGKASMVDYKDHWVSLSQLIYSNWGYGYSKPGYQDDLSFQLGISIWICLGLALTILIRTLAVNRKVDNQSIIYGSGVVGILLLSLFLMLQNSQFIWQLFPFLAYLQYPWRFLALAILAGSMLSVWVINMLNNKVLALILITLSLVNIRNYRQPWTPDRYTDQDYQQEPGLMTGSTDISWELLPVWVDKPLTNRPATILATNPESQIQVIKETKYTSTKHFLTIESSKPQLLDFNLYYLPSWNVFINGNKAQTRPSDQGLLSVIIPQGSIDVLVELGKTPIEQMSDLVSLISVCYLGYVLVSGKIKVSDQDTNSNKSGP